MHPLSRILTSLTIVLAGFLFVPVAVALPGTGAVKLMPLPKPASALPLTNKQGVVADNATLKELIKQVGLRIRIGHGYYYPRRYYGYRRPYYSPSYRYGYRRHYRHYRRYPRYGRHRYSRRYKRYKRRRALRHLRRLLRHRLYY